jgi:hypothetical protein
MLSGMTTDIPTVEEIKAMTVQEYKVLENRLRRAADRQGLSLAKSRARDPRDTTYGTYMLVDQHTNGVVFADWVLQRGFGLNLRDVANYLFADINVLVYDGPDHEMAKWLDENNFDGEPFIHYRHGSTTKARDDRGRPLPDGWVLYTPADSDEYIIGACDADDAVAEAREYLRRYP